MKTLLHKLPIRWILRITIASIISYVTGLSLGWCILAYIGVMFLIRFSLNMLLVLVGCALMVGVFMVLFFGLLTL